MCYGNSVRAFPPPQLSSTSAHWRPEAFGNRIPILQYSASIISLFIILIYEYIWLTRLQINTEKQRDKKQSGCDHRCISTENRHNDKFGNQRQSGELSRSPSIQLLTSFLCIPNSILFYIYFTVYCVSAAPSLTWAASWQKQATNGLISATQTVWRVKRRVCRWGEWLPALAQLRTMHHSLRWAVVN